jgi:excisionase family DNA binding protein
MTPTNDSPRDYLTTAEVAAWLKVSVFTVRRWIKQGDLSARKVGREWRIPREALGARLLNDQDDASSSA